MMKMMMIVMMNMIMMIMMIVLMKCGHLNRTCSINMYDSDCFLYFLLGVYNEQGDYKTAQILLSEAKTLCCDVAKQCMISATIAEILDKTVRKLSFCNFCNFLPTYSTFIFTLFLFLLSLSFPLPLPLPLPLSPFLSRINCHSDNSIRVSYLQQ